jgi:hypothetical protein
MLTILPPIWVIRLTSWESRLKGTLYSTTLLRTPPPTRPDTLMVKTLSRLGAEGPEAGLAGAALDGEAAAA